MNKYITAITIVFLAFSLVAQTSEDEGLHTRYRPGIGWFYSGMNIFQPEKLHKYDRLMVDIVYNDWHGDDTKFFKSPWSSIGVNASLMFDFVLTKQNTVSLGVGLGFSHFSNRTKLFFHRDFDEKFTTISQFDSANEPLRTKFGANYIEIPLELRFRTKGFEHFKFMIGGKIGYQLTSYNKETIQINGKNYTHKHLKFPDSNPLRYGVTVRFGIRNWAIYGAYYFSPLFNNSQSVELYPYSLGLTISLF